MNLDTLTGAARRGDGERFGEERLAHEPMGAVYVALDHFKAVNDRMGHDAGDRLLRETVVRLPSACRAGDLVVRLGGDENAPSFPGMRSEDSTRLWQRIRSAIAGGPPIVAMSLGGSWAPPPMTRCTRTSACAGHRWADGEPT